MTKPEDSLNELFARMRSEALPVRTEDEEDAREDRLVGLIDDCVARLPVEEAPKANRHTWVYLLLAACLGVGGVAIVLKQRHGVSPIESEPLAARQNKAPELVPSATKPAPESPKVGSDTGRVELPKHQPRSAGSTSKTNSEPATPKAASSTPSATPSPGTSASTLSQENRLFQVASQAEQAGDVGGALKTYDQLVREYPRSPLAQNALARKFGILSRVGRKAEAMDEARRYLRAYPSGFAEREAASILSEPRDESGKGPDAWPDAGNSRP